jgi:hypothetical protein
MVSPFINECAIILNAFILIFFIFFHFVFKYGNCGIINIERFFLQENFKDGFFYKLIKPVISYKNNIFYYKFLNIIILYLIILAIQIYNNNCLKIIYDNIVLI